MDYLVISIRNNQPYPYGFNDKAEALEFCQGQIKEGLIYSTLWFCDDSGTMQPLDLEAVERNLKSAGIWL